MTSYSYCPWCGSSAGTTQEAAGLKRVAEEEKLRQSRHNEALCFILACIDLIPGIVCVRLVRSFLEKGIEFPLEVIPALGVLSALTRVSFFMYFRYYRRRQDSTEKLEKGRFE